MFKIFTVAAAMAAAGIAASAGATTITPVSVSATSTFWTYDVNNLINGSGLSADGLHDRFYSTHWMTDLGVSRAQLTFDLGAVYQLVSADIWQFNYADPYPVNPLHIINTIDRGVKDFNILISTDGVDYTQVFSGRMTRENGDPAAAQNFSFAGEAQYVKLDLLNNYAEGSIYDPYATGLGEVRFNSADVGAVPEPATWAMMIGGFALVGATMRRRHKVAVSFA
jgi:hypothetical protein